MLHLPNSASRLFLAAGFLTLSIFCPYSSLSLSLSLSSEKRYIPLKNLSFSAQDLREVECYSSICLTLKTLSAIFFHALNLII